MAVVFNFFMIFIIHLLKGDYGRNHPLEAIWPIMSFFALVFIFAIAQLIQLPISRFNRKK